MTNQRQATQKSLSRKIKVLGLGGSGCNTISRLSALNLDGIELIAANTDFHSLSTCKADKVIRLGTNTTNGLGAGGDLSTGRTAAEESYKDLIECIQGSDLLFLTTGLGGGTGSGAIEIAARIAASLDILTISIVTLPFSFEAEKRKSIAYEVTINLQPFTNTLITIPNDRLVDLAAPNTSHISKLMKNGGGAYISIGYGQGKERITSAIQNALIHPLLEKTPIHQARGIIIKLTGDLKINEIDFAITYLKEKVGEDTEIIPVVEQTETSDDQVMASILLTGIGATPLPYQDIYQHKATEPNEQDFVSVDSNENLVFSKSLDNYEDILEVPAFLRKGYNSNKTY